MVTLEDIETNREIATHRVIELKSEVKWQDVNEYMKMISL